MPWSIADPGRRSAVTSMLAGAVRREPLAATDGRSGSLSGLLRRVPEVIEHAILAVEREGDGWVVVMRDMTPALLPAGVAEEALERWSP